MSRLTQIATLAAVWVHIAHGYGTTAVRAQHGWFYGTVTGPGGAVERVRLAAAGVVRRRRRSRKSSRSGPLSCFRGLLLPLRGSDENRGICCRTPLFIYQLNGRGHRQLRSSCRRGRRCGRNCPVAATRRWRCRESIVAAVADAVVIPFRPADVCFHPLVPVGPVGVLLAVAHSQTAKTPLPTRAVALRDVRLVRVWRISAGNRSRRHNHRSSA
jgi:hypothetical protein